jgi:hypothetical protein
MAFTDIKYNSGKVYESGEKARLEDYMNQQEKIFSNIDNTTDKDKKIIRYSIVLGGGLLVIILLSIAVKFKNKK